MLINPYVQAQNEESLSQFEDYLASTQESIAVMWQNMDKVWEGVNYSNYSLLVTNGQSLWEITVDGIEERWVGLMALQWSYHGTNFNFGMVNWNNQPTLIVELDESYTNDRLTFDEVEAITPAPYLAVFATHELFHFTVQQTWNIQKSQDIGSRSSLYPLKVPPRLLRYQLYLSLVDAYAYPEMRQPHLAAASYWYKKWRHDYPDEWRKAIYVDLMEATAQYADTSAAIGALVGFDTTTDEFREIASTWLREQVEQLWVPNLDQESYFIGLVAGLVAQEEIVAWKQAAEKGTPPVAFLLEDILPVEQIISNTAQTRIEDLVRTSNVRVEFYVEPAIERYLDSEKLLLVVPNRGNAFRLEGFYASPILPSDWQILAGLNTRLILQSGTIEINITGLSGNISECNYPELTAQYIFPLNSDDVVITDNRLNINQTGLTGSFNIESTKNDTGRVILCAQ